ncbi:ankyrin repeat domain-containing protein [Plantactinospora solaniradicis]|uniref:Ankyrin repeat domain-containing protein n=1 Tax=Plantactinospora solaniradicis TaxID=1723736 RepID=A0ABW1KK06_9ACTN
MTQPVLPEIRVWQRVRRYAVPTEMIEACTEAREAGDWRAGLTAGRVDVGFDLAEVAREHGRRQAERIEVDLAALAPDLLRWHLPRTLGGRTSLATHQQWLLSVREDRIQGTDAALVLHVPKVVDGSQRLRLTVGPAADEQGGRRDLPPVFWSPAHLHGLAAAHGGSTHRLPGFEPDGRVRPFEAYPTTVGPADPASRAEVFDRHLAAGELVSAWAAAGVDLDPRQPDTYRYGKAIDAAAAGALVPVGLDAEMARLHVRYGVSEVVIGDRWRFVVGVRRRDDGTLAASFLGYEREHFSRPRLASVVHGRPVDLELVRHGLLDPAALHPLVRQALFPQAPAGLPARDERLDLRLEVPVRCGTEWHTVVHADGRLDLPSHTADEVAREQVLRTLGGPVSGCFAAAHAWHGSGGRLPRPLRHLRRDVLQRIQHGGSAALTALLDAGLDPRLVDGRGGTLLHHMRAVRDGALVGRLLEAGVPVDATNRRGRTALIVTISEGGTPEMVRTLLEAGADPQAKDEYGVTAVELANSKAAMYEDDEDVPEEYRPPILIRDVVNDWMDRDGN